jgi:hypothetical protein
MIQLIHIRNKFFCADQDVAFYPAYVDRMEYVCVDQVCPSVVAKSFHMQ